MTSNNFRIGNLVNYGGYASFCEIVTIHAGGNLKVRPLNYSGEADETGVSKVSLIPITKEILLKFGGDLIEEGFDSDEGGKVCVVNFDRFRLRYAANKGYWAVVRSDWQEEYISRVSYVHEWQNLFYALNREELKYQPKKKLQ